MAGPDPSPFRIGAPNETRHRQSSFKCESHFAYTYLLGISFELTKLDDETFSARIFGGEVSASRRSTVQLRDKSRVYRNRPVILP